MADFDWSTAWGGNNTTQSKPSGGFDWSTAWSQTPRPKPQSNWFQKGLDFAGSLLDPFTFLGDLTRSAMFDLTTRQGWSRTQSVANDWSRYVPGGQRPNNIAATGSELLQAWGSKNETYNRWGGMMLDIFADPLLAGSATRIVAKGVGGASTALGRTLITAANSTDAAFSARGLLQGASWAATGGRNAMLAENYGASLVKRMMDSDGFLGKIGEATQFVVGRPVVGAGRDYAAPIFGGKDKAGNSLRGVVPLAEDDARQVQRMVEVNVRDISKSFEAVSAGKSQVFTVLDEQLQTLLDKRTLSDPTAFLRDSQPFVGFQKSKFDKLAALSQASVKGTKEYADTISKITAVAQREGLEVGKVLDSFDDAIGRATAVQANLGYKLSRFDEFDRAIRAAAAQTGVSVDEAYAQVWQKALDPNAGMQTILTRKITAGVPNLGTGNRGGIRTQPGTYNDLLRRPAPTAAERGGIRSQPSGYEASLGQQQVPNLTSGNYRPIQGTAASTPPSRPFGMGQSESGAVRYDPETGEVFILDNLVGGRPRFQDSGFRLQPSLANIQRQRASEFRPRYPNAESGVRLTPNQWEATLPNQQISRFRDEGFRLTPDYASVERQGVDAFRPFDNAEAGIRVEPNDFWQALTQEWGGRVGQTLDPLDYVKGLTAGYMRRVIGAKVNADEVIKGFDKRLTIPLHDVDPTTLRGTLDANFGAQAADAIELYLKVNPGKSVNSATLYNAAKNAMPGVSFDKFKLAIGEVLDPGRRNTERIIADLEAAQQKAKADYVNETAAGGLRTSKFEQRQDLSEEVLAELGKVESATSSLAVSGLLTAKAVRGQEVMNGLADELGKAGALLDENAWKALPQQERNLYRFVKGKTWGALSGLYIPKTIHADIVGMYASQAGPADGLAQVASGLFNKIRGWYLGTPVSSVRDLIGNFALAHSAGVDVLDMAAHIPKAVAAVNKYNKDGWTDDLAELGTMPHFLSNIGLTRELTDTAELGIITSAARGVKDANGFLANMLEAVKNPANITAPIDIPVNAILRNRQYNETILRTAIYLSTRNQLTKFGKPMEEAALDALHLATHATYDYGTVSAGVNALRNTGLATFPSFTYFTVGRFARAAVERPGALAANATVPEALNRAVTGEDEEPLNAVMASWLQQNVPLGIPLPIKDYNQDGSTDEKDKRYAILPLSPFLPFSGIESDKLTGTAGDTALFGILKPIAETIIAFARGDGKAIMSEKFGKQVFNPGSDEGPWDRAVAAMNFLVDGYSPGLVRSVVNPITNASPVSIQDALKGNPQPGGSLTGNMARMYTMSEAEAQAYVEETLKFTNQDWRQLIAKATIGSTYITDLDPSGTSATQAQRNEVRNLNEQMNPVRREIVKREQQISALEATRNPAFASLILKLKQEIAVLEGRMNQIGDKATQRIDQLDRTIQGGNP